MVKISDIRKLNAIIIFRILKYNYMQIFSNQLSFLSKRAIFDPFDPLLTPKVTRKGSNFQMSIK